MIITAIKNLLIIPLFIFLIYGVCKVAKACTSCVLGALLFGGGVLCLGWGAICLILYGQGSSGLFILGVILVAFGLVQNNKGTGVDFPRHMVTSRHGRIDLSDREWERDGSTLVNRLNGVRIERNADGDWDTSDDFNNDGVSAEYGFCTFE